MNAIEPIQWCSGFATGVPEIDLQHRILIDRFNNVSSRLGNDGDLADWQHVGYEVLSYALYHFSTEEKLAEQYGYDREEVADALSHREDHRRFTEYMEKVRDRLNLGEQIPKAEFLAFVAEWLLKHIAHSDHDLGAFICAKQRASKADKEHSHVPTHSISRKG